MALIDWELWAIAAPFIVWLSGRVRFARGHWRLPLAVHVLVGVAIGGLKLFVEASLKLALLGYGRGPSVQQLVAVYGQFGVENWLPAEK